MVGAQAGHSAGKGAMCRSVKALAQPDYSAFKADIPFISKMSLFPWFCIAEIAGPRQGCSAASLGMHGCMNGSIGL